jgi:hypothetical protein
MAIGAADQHSNDPVTLHRIMQTMIGEGLKERYEAPQKLSHQLFVLLMQLNEQERKGNGRMSPLRRANGADDKNLARRGVA